MPDLLTQSQYAAHREALKAGGADITGTTRQAVSLKVKSGVLEGAITWQDGKAWIDPDEADRLWEESAKNAKSEKGPVLTRRRTLDGSPGETITRAQAQAEREAINAARAEIALEEEAERLVSRDKVHQQVFAGFRTCRDMLRALPAKLATELAAETTPNGVREALHREINYCLAELERKLNGL